MNKQQENEFQSVLFEAYDPIKQETRDIIIEIPKGFHYEMKEYDREKFKNESKPRTKKDYERNPPLYFKDKLSTMRLCRDKSNRYYIKICDETFDLIQRTKTRFQLEVPKGLILYDPTDEEEYRYKMKRNMIDWKRKIQNSFPTKLSKDLLEDTRPRTYSSTSLDENALVNLQTKDDDEGEIC